MSSPTPTDTTEKGRVWLKILTFPLVLAWLLYAVSKYVPDVSVAVLGQTGANAAFWLERLGIIDSALVLWLCAVAAGIGGGMLVRLGFVFRSHAERFFWGAAGGLSAFSLLMLLLGVCGLYYRLVAYLLLAVSTLILVWTWRHGRFSWERPGSAGPRSAGVSPASGSGSIDGASPISRQDACAPRALPASLSPLSFLVIAYLVAVLGLVWFSAISPETDWDPLLVHLFAPERYVQSHRIVALPEVPQTFFPRHVTMLFTLGMLLNGEITAKLIHFMFGILCILGVYVVGEQLFGRKVGVLGACILVASPLFVWEMRTAHLELGLSFFVFAAIAATIRWLRDREKRWFWMAGVYLAFAQGTKYHAILALACLPAALFVSDLRRSGFTKALRAAILMGLVGAAGLLPWAVVNAVQTGNPVFPFLNGTFKSPFWTDANTEMGVREMRGAGTPVSWRHPWEIPRVYWSMVTEPGQFRGNIGPFYLLFIPLLALRWRQANGVALRVVLLFSLGYSLLWMFTGQHARYFLPLLPGLAVVAAFSLSSWLTAGGNRFSSRFLNAAVLLVVGAMFLLSTPFFEAHGGGSAYGCTIEKSLSADYLFKRQSRDDYRTGIVQSNAVVMRLNELPGNKKVLFWWNTGPCLFLAKCDALCYYSPWFSEFISADVETLRQRMLAHGITHVIAGQDAQEGHLITRPEGEFVRRHMKKVFQKYATVLYEFSPAPLDQESVYFDFLNHIEEARISMPNHGPYPNRNYKTLFSIKDDVRMCLLTVSPARVEYRVRVPEKARMTFSVGQSFLSCSGVGAFSVDVIPPDGRRVTVYRRELHAEGRPEDTYWLPAEVELSEYANQDVTIVFATEHLGGLNCAWYVFADPEIVCPATSWKQ